MYRQIQSRRGHAMAELKKLTPGPVRPAAAPIGPLRAGSSALTLPIAAARLLQGNSPWFGSSGMVQMGRAQEGTNLQAQGHYPTSGSISTAARGATGFISFNGLLSVGPDEESLPQSDPYDPTLRYFWLHNWNYLIFFPAPRVTSTFTYSLGVAVLAYLFLHEGPVTLMSFVSVGETPDFVGTDVVVDTDAGWPLMVDLTQPYYANGSVWGGINYFGWVQGSSSVQRSFLVQGGHTPAVALVVGMVSAQAMATKIDRRKRGARLRPSALR